MNTVNRPSLLELAAQAAEAEQQGAFHAGYAIEGDQLGKDGIARIQKAATAGHEDSAAALQALEESREATFTDPFARAEYLKARIGLLATQEKPAPEMVLQTMFSAQAARMHFRGESGRETRPAIPLFKAIDDRREAQKFLGQNVLPIRVIDSNREDQGGMREHITGDSFKFLIPTSPSELKCYEQLRQLLARMPAVLATEFEGLENYDVRQAVWLALNLVPGARVFHPGAVKRIFEATKDGKLEGKRNGRFVQFELSKHETLVLDDTADNQRIIARLQIFVETVKNIVKRR